MTDEGYQRERGLLCSWAISKLYEGGGDAHGNVSSRIDKHHFWIKPSGVKKADLSELCLIRIVAYGGGMPPTIEVREGKLKPSVDAVHHASLYINHDWLKAICHTHSKYVVAHAIAGKDIACLSTEQADIFGGTVHCLEYRGLDEWGMQVHLVEKDQAVLLGRHGGLTFSDNPMKAVELSKRLEEIAEKNFLANQLFHPVSLWPLPEKEIKRWRKRYLKGYGQRKS